MATILSAILLFSVQYLELSQAPISERNILLEEEGQKYLLHSLENEAELYMMQKVAELGIGPQIVALL